jgi:SAM-dependent methyltransferase
MPDAVLHVSDDGRLPAVFAEAGSVDETISPLERMPSADVPGYLGVGESALKAVRLALLAARRPDPTTILDLPCGHGRVLRWLAAAYPQARLTASDLLVDGVDFCAATWGAAPVYSVQTPTAELFPDRYDLIWVGSLLTHLNAHRWDDFVDLFVDLLAPGGVAVLTTCGPVVAARMRAGHGYGYPADVVTPALADYDARGFAFLPATPGETDYGLAVASPGWAVARVLRRPELRLTTYTEALWANHQDVLALTKMPVDTAAAESPYT